MPRARIGSCGHLNLYGVSVLFLQAPSHIASVLVVLISRPDTCLNLHSSSIRFDTEAWSLTNTVVSSVNCEHFISFLPMLTPLIELVSFMSSLQECWFKPLGLLYEISLDRYIHVDIKLFHHSTFVQNFTFLALHKSCATR